MVTLTNSEWSEIYDQMAHLIQADKQAELKGFLDAVELFIGKDGSEKIQKTVRQYIEDEKASRS